MQPELPEKYYLSHANELFDCLKTYSTNLLTREALDYLTAFEQLSKDAQCLLIRCLARKPRIIKQQSLAYQEIHNLENALDECFAAGFLSRPQAQDWPELLEQLTKAELVQLLCQAQFKCSSSALKSELVGVAQEQLSFNELQSNAANRVVRRKQSLIDYLFFLFFGNLNNQFQKFVMRDLGVLRTKTPSKLRARFESLDAAQSCFELHCLQRQIKAKKFDQIENLSKQVLSHHAIGESAQECRDLLLFRLGELSLTINPEEAIELWRQSEHPNALEARIRQQYKIQNKGQLKIELERLQQQSLAPSSQIFVADFYARKYQGKRTSIYTDMLRQSERQLNLDEVYINSVEQGAIEYYQQQGNEAFFCENQFWRVLFGLTLWPVLWGSEHAQHNEFDRLPKRLQQVNFYEEFKLEIEAELDRFTDPRQLSKTLTKRASQFYGQSNGLFRWRAGMLDAISAVLRCHNAERLSEVLRDMAKRFRFAKDGYPDLVVIHADQFRFEEIKSPGDQLRSNQVVAIGRLKHADIAVEITQVKWAINPNQTYAVVDIETTGGRKGGNAITEIAVVTLQDGKVIREWSTLVNPKRFIPNHITRLTGIDNAMVANAPTFTELADTIETELADSIFVAHNVGFDYGFIQSAFESIGRRFYRPRCCTVRMARKTFPGLSSYSLGSLTAHFDIDLNGHHRALNDARATADLLRLIQAER